MNFDIPFKLGQCVIKPREYSLELPNGNIKVLQPKYIDVLRYLAHQYPRVVDRAELIESIWDGNFYVGEKSLTNAVWNLRSELKKFDVSCIETVRKKGYRLQIKPEFLDKEVAALTIKSSQVIKHPFYRRFAVMFTVLFTLFILVSLMSKNTESESTIEILNVVSDPGREVYPSISPDNKHLIYSWRRIGQHPNLYLKDMSNLDVSPTQLTFSEFYEGRVVWDGNGEDIYYQRKHWNYEQCDIVKLNIMTLESEILGQCTGEVDFSLAISPDSTLLAYVATGETKQTTVKLLHLEDKVQTATLYQCGSDCRYDELDVAFSPDGQHLVISRTLDEGFNEDLFLFDIEKKELEQLTVSEGDIKGLAWHPDGDRIIYSANVSGSRDAYIVSLDSKMTTKLNIPGFSYPRFIPNSQDVIFHNWRELSSLSSLSLGGDLAASPFPFMQSEYSYHSPHYSSAVNRLAFISNESGFDEIWMSNIDGTARTKLTNLSSHLTFPRWSHDGKSIAFLGPKTKSKRNTLYVLNVKTQIVRQVNSEFKQHFRPSWLIDDSGIIAAAKANNSVSLYIFPINEELPYKILDQKVTYAEQDLAGNIWFTPGRNQGLWVFNPKNINIEPKQVLNKELFRVSYKWELTEHGVYFQHDFENSHQIHFLDLKTEKVTPLVLLPIGTINRLASMTYIPSQSKIIFTQRESPKIDIKRLRHHLLR